MKNIIIFNLVIKLKMPLLCKECPKGASFGYTKPEYCKTHKKDDMVDVKSKR